MGCLVSGEICLGRGPSLVLKPPRISRDYTNDILSSMISFININLGTKTMRIIIIDCESFNT